MAIIAMIVCSFIACFDFLKHKKIYSPSVVFSILFFICVFLCNLNYYRLPQVKARVYFMILIGVASFFLGQSLADRKKIDKRKMYKGEIELKRYNLLMWISVVCSWFVIKDPLNILLSGGKIIDIYAARISAVYTESEYFQYSAMEGLITSYIINPIFMLSVILSLILFYKTYRVRFALISLLFLFLQVITTGGRVNILVFIIVNLVCFLENKKNREFLRKNKFKFIGFILVGIIFFIYVQVERGSTILEVILRYYGVALNHMDYKLDFIESQGYTYGFMSLRPFISLLSYIPETLGLDRFYLLERANEYVYLIDEATYLGNGVVYNAFVTCFYYFFTDFGYIGIVIFSTLFGYFSGICYKKFTYFRDDRSKVIFYLSLALPICFAVVRFQYSQATVPFAMIYASKIFFSTKTIKINLKM